MAYNLTLCALLVLLLGLISSTQAGASNCTKDDLMISQRQVARGEHAKWKLVVRSKCAACEASVVELQCPGWVEGKAIEGYMYPVELVDTNLCMLGGTVTLRKPFSTVYEQPAGKINLKVVSTQFHCSDSSSHTTPQP